MTSSERLYRAELARCWRAYRTSRHLPITHEYAAKDVRRVIDDIRAYASRRGASRPPSWDRQEATTQYRIAAE
ncbi:hypothetical protein [Paracoccus kondratievae]|uniref:hypothetical protein n=1 Tax=Paracoccus kondratievae TaxID=135740 RepID=UPI000FDF9246|nr:hypothetical protein [Paracoccus kondratievae]AZV00244.1 hypothetical protein pkon1_p15 [Paracoccus phage vB_PkoS_Pkon1]